MTRSSRTAPPTSLQPSTLKMNSHSAPTSPLYPPQTSFAQSQARARADGRAAGGGPNARRSWAAEETLARPIPRSEEGFDRNLKRNEAKHPSSSRTMSSHSSDSSASEKSGSSLRTGALSVSSTSSASTAIVTPRTSNLGPDEWDLKAPSPLSLPSLLPTSKADRRKSGFGVIKGWFGSKKEGGGPPSATRVREASTDSASSFIGVPRPTSTPAEANSTLGLSLQRSSEPSPPRRPSPASTGNVAPPQRVPLKQQQPTARETYRATGAVPTPSFNAQPTAVAPPFTHSRSSSSSALPQLARPPPVLTPLQSLHLLSSQKLSIMLRPSPHPLFLSRTAQRPSLTPLGGGAVSMGRRFPASTNPLTRRNRQRHLGLVCEVGVKTVMRKLEEGTAAAQKEMDALVRLFEVRPVSLTRDKTGRYVASISDPLDLDASLVDAMAPPMPLGKSASSGQLRSGILAFIERPPFEQRYTETLPHPQVPDRTFSFDVVRPRQKRFSSPPRSTLEFSLAIRSLAIEVESGRVFKTMTSKSPSASSTLLPTIASGRTSPTDRVRERTQPLVVDAPPALPPVVVAATNLILKRRSSPPLRSTPVRSSTLPFPPSSTPASLAGVPRIDTQTGAGPARSTLTVPESGPKRSGTITRRSVSFSALTQVESSVSAAANDDDDDEEDDDVLPLAMIARRQSFAALTGQRPTSTTPPAPSPSTPTTPIPALPPAPTKPARGVRFSVDTETLLKASEDRLAIEAKAERDRQRGEEEERKRQERYKAEVAAARERRESNKAGTKKGNGGQYEDWTSLSRRAGSATTLPSKASMRDLALPPAPAQASTFNTSTLKSSTSPNTLAAGLNAPPSSFGPRSRSSRQFVNEHSSTAAMARSQSQEQAPTQPQSYRPRVMSSNDLQPPSLVSNSGNSSPQTSLSSYTPSPSHQRQPSSLSVSKRPANAPAPSHDGSNTATIRSRPTQQLKSQHSAATLTQSSASAQYRQEPPRLNQHRSSPAIPTMGHFYPYPPTPPMPQPGQMPHLMDFGPPAGYAPYPLYHQYHQAYPTHVHYPHPSQQLHPVHYASRTHQSPNLR